MYHANVAGKDIVSNTSFRDAAATSAFSSVYYVNANLSVYYWSDRPCFRRNQAPSARTLQEARRRQPQPSIESTVTDDVLLDSADTSYIYFVKSDRTSHICHQLQEHVEAG